jgi:hypothetical protein
MTEKTKLSLWSTTCERSGGFHFSTCEDILSSLYKHSGGLSEIELLSFTEFSVQALEKKRIAVARAFMGTFQVCLSIVTERPCLARRGK